jgi:hypothetical protein
MLVRAARPEPPVDLAERTERFRALVTAPDPEALFVLEVEGRIAGHGGVNATHAKASSRAGSPSCPRRAEPAAAGTARRDRRSRARWRGCSG